MVFFQQADGKGLGKNLNRLKILITCFDNVGDLVFVSGITRTLRESYPDSEIHLWCKEYTAQIADLMPGVDHYFSNDPFWDNSPLRPKGSLWPFLKSIWQARKQSYDLAVVTAACWRSALACYLTGAKQLWGYNRVKSRFFLSKTVTLPQKKKPVVGELLRLLSLGSDGKSMAYYSLLTPQIPKSKPLWPFIGLHPFAGNRKRCAALPFWMALRKHLLDKGYRILWLGSTGELQEIRDGHIHEATEFLDYYTPEATLKNLTSMISQATLFIGHDSGPLHIAGALGIPVVGLYLPSEYHRTFPQGPQGGDYIVKPSPSDLQIEDLTIIVDRILAGIPRSGKEI